MDVMQTLLRGHDGKSLTDSLASISDIISLQHSAIYREGGFFPNRAKAFTMVAHSASETRSSGGSLMPASRPSAIVGIKPPQLHICESIALYHNTAR